MKPQPASGPQKKPRNLDAAVAAGDSIDFTRKTIFWWLPILYLLICDAFYLRTYDSAQVKITLVQMGGLCLLALWMCRIVEEGLMAFSKDDVVCLAPFAAYLFSGIISFIHAPYHWSSTDFFLRRIFYMTVPLIVIQEFNEEAVGRLTRIIIWSAWLSIGYGTLQWFDINFFPGGVGNGPDPFIWRWAFGSRVFSTYGNPNFLADFLVIMFPLLVCQWLKTRAFNLLVLSFLDVFVLYGTVTKGAWIGFGIASSVLLGTYFYFFEREKLRAYRLYIASTMAVLVFGGMLAAVLKMRTIGYTSVNFRLFTWEATWEMIMTQPIRGTGLGSFWVIYPAFRRPPIFHIEGKHNTETDHSEDEYLEVLMDEGILGFGIFLWLILSTWVIAYRSLAQLTGSLKKGERAPPRAYELMGWLVAFQGMLIHNFFDVSMRFVSSGVYLGLLSGVVVNRSRGFSLSELHARREAPSVGGSTEPGFWESVSDFFIWPARLGAWAGLCWMGWRLLTQFTELQGPLFRLQLGGEILQWWISWSVFLGCVLFLAVAFIRIVSLTRNALVPLVTLMMLWPLNMAWGFFRADVYHNIAIFFSKQQNWDQALKHYIMVGELNPAYIMSFYFKGNVFNDRFNMAKIYNPAWGDKDNVARDDFERAFAAYEEVRARAPNYVQMHHQVGALFMKHGEWLMNQGRAEEGQKEWDKALERFQMYRNIDPVFPPNYYRMGQIYMVRKDYAKAVEIYKALIDAKECRIAPWLLQRPFLRNTILRYQEYANDNGLWVHRHDSVDAYTNLANAYFMKGDLGEAEKAYKKALAMDPNAVNAQRNLQVLYQKAQSMGRLRQAPSLPVAPGLPAAPPALEVFPSKR